MDSAFAQDTNSATRGGPELIGRVAIVTGSQATVELNARAFLGERPTVGKYMGLVSGKSVIIGLITEVGEQTLSAAGSSQNFRKMARLDLIGEIQSGGSGAARFQRGITDYPSIGDAAMILGERELRLVYGAADADHAHIGNLQQNTNIGATKSAIWMLEPTAMVMTRSIRFLRAK